MCLRGHGGKSDGVKRMTFKPGDILKTKDEFNKSLIPRYQVVEKTGKAYNHLNIREHKQGMYDTVKFHGSNLRYFEFAFELVPEDQRDEALNYMVERAMEAK